MFVANLSSKKKASILCILKCHFGPPMSNHALSWTPFASSPGRPIVNFPPAPSFASAGWASAYNFAQPCAGCDVTQSCHPQAFFGSPLTLDLGLAEWRSFHAPRSFMKNEKKKTGSVNNAKSASGRTSTTNGSQSEQRLCTKRSHSGAAGLI